MTSDRPKAKKHTNVWDPDKKKHIRCLFICKWSNNTNLYDLGLLTDDFTFYHCKLASRYVDITSDFWLKVRKMFAQFQFTATTDVQKTSNISDFEPIASYLKILQSQLHFKMRSVEQFQVLNRIKAYHPTYAYRKNGSKKTTLVDITRLWEKILKYNKCPWITEEVDDQIKDLSQTLALRHKYIRLAAYYILIKQVFYSQYKKQKEKENTSREQNNLAKNDETFLPEVQH